MVGLVWWVWFGRFGLGSLTLWVWFCRIGFVGMVMEAEIWYVDCSHTYKIN